MEESHSITKRIIGYCFEVHKEIGPGFKEFEVFYLNKKVGSFRTDLIVENQVIVEIKSLAGNIPIVFEHQLISYLKASRLHVGLLINFSNKSCQVKRVVF